MPTLSDLIVKRRHYICVQLTHKWRQVGSAPGSLEGGYLISKAAVRRIACDANIIPVVLGTAGQPLDIGRATRLVPQGLRRALILRDEGCAFPGCDHWADGGHTSLCNTASC